MSRVLVICVLVIVATSQHVYREDSIIDHGLEIAGFVLLVIGVMGRIWCAGYISGNKTNQIVRIGPYSISRNPLYFFSFLVLMGAGFACESILIAGLLVLIFFVTHWPKILKEERKLEGLHGQDYRDYINTVPRFIPRFFRYHARESTSNISPKAFDHAVKDGILLLLIFGIAHLNEVAHQYGYLPTWFIIP